VKGSGFMSRSEWETEIPTEVFTALWPKTEGRRVEKVRYEIAYSGVLLEVDEYRGDLAGLYTLEVEFKTEVAAHEFILPTWAMDAIDVTTQAVYKERSPLFVN
jgi:adenylate cyclase